MEGKNGGFVIYEDHPDDWEYAFLADFADTSSAWDVEYYHSEKATPFATSSCAIKENGPLRCSLECRLKFGASEATVRFSLDALPAGLREDSRSSIRIDTEIQWHKTHSFLKFEIPTSIWASEATYDAAFGVVKRPTYRNTTWESAKLEVCAHKFADFE